MTFPNSNVLRCLAANAVPKTDIDAQTQDTNAGEKQVTKFLNRLGGSVADWRPYGEREKQKRPAQGRPFHHLNRFRSD
jgi:hypothetical protein